MSNDEIGLLRNRSDMEFVRKYILVHRLAMRHRFASNLRSWNTALSRKGERCETRSAVQDCGKWHTKRLLAMSFCSLCSKMLILNPETLPGPHLHQYECSPCALWWLYGGFGGGRKVWAPASAGTFLHHLPLVFSPRSFFPVAMLGMTVPSCFRGRKTVDFSLSFCR